MHERGQLHAVYKPTIVASMTSVHVIKMHEYVLSLTCSAVAAAVAVSALARVVIHQIQTDDAVVARRRIALVRVQYCKKKFSS